MSPAAAHDATIRAMAATKAPRREIAEATGLSLRQVRNYMEEQQIAGRPQGEANPIADDVRAKLLALLHGGMSATKAAAMCGVSHQTAAKMRVAAGLQSFTKPWQAHEEQVLLKLHAQGARPKQISDQLPGRSTQAVHARAQALGLSFGVVNRRTADVFDRVRQLAAAGTPDREIAVELGLSTTGVSKLRRSNGIPSSKQLTLRPKAEKAPRKARVETAPPPPAVRTGDGYQSGYRMVRLDEAWRWWWDQGHKGYADISEINDLRRKEKRAPFTIKGGKFTGIAA